MTTDQTWHLGSGGAGFVAGGCVVACAVAATRRHASTASTRRDMRAHGWTDGGKAKVYTPWDLTALPPEFRCGSDGRSRDPPGSWIAQSTGSALDRHFSMNPQSAVSFRLHRVLLPVCGRVLGGDPRRARQAPSAFASRRVEVETSPALSVQSSRPPRARAMLLRLALGAVLLAALAYAAPLPPKCQIWCVAEPHRLRGLMLYPQSVHGSRRIPGHSKGSERAADPDADPPRVRHAHRQSHDPCKYFPCVAGLADVECAVLDHLQHLPGSGHPGVQERSIQRDDHLHWSELLLEWVRHHVADRCIANFAQHHYDHGEHLETPGLHHRHVEAAHRHVRRLVALRLWLVALWRGLW